MGSEMCIRDSISRPTERSPVRPPPPPPLPSKDKKGNSSPVSRHEEIMLREKWKRIQLPDRVRLKSLDDDDDTPKAKHRRASRRSSMDNAGVTIGGSDRPKHRKAMRRSSMDTRLDHTVASDMSKEVSTSSINASPLWTKIRMKGGTTEARKAGFGTGKIKRKANRRSSMPT